MAGFPAASTAVTVIGSADPEVVEAGAVTLNPTAPARLAALSLAFITTVTPALLR